MRLYVICEYKILKAREGVKTDASPLKNLL